MQGKMRSMQAPGDYIVFADSDDLLDTGLLERLREAVLREAPDIVAFGYQLFDANGVLLKNKKCAACRRL